MYCRDAPHQGGGQNMGFGRNPLSRDIGYPNFPIFYFSIGPRRVSANSASEAVWHCNLDQLPDHNGVRGNH
jgi:hypothetical protein